MTHLTLVPDEGDCTATASRPAKRLLDDELVARFSSGYKFTHPYAIARGLWYVRDEADAEDLYNDVVLKLWQRWTRPVNPEPFPKSDEHFRNIVYRWMRDGVKDRRTAVRNFRLGTTEGKLPSDVPLSDVCVEMPAERGDTNIALLTAARLYEEPEDDTPDRAELAGLLWTTIAQLLSEHAQNVMKVWCEQDYDRAETAKALDMRVEAVSKQLHRAKQVLRDELLNVERGYMKPDSPWYETIRRNVEAYDRWLEWQSLPERVKRDGLLRLVRMAKDPDESWEEEELEVREEESPVAREAAAMAEAVDRRLERGETTPAKLPKPSTA